MNNNIQTNNDFTAGFLTKDKSGKFKKVNVNGVTDYKATSQVKQNSIQSVAQAEALQEKSGINSDKLSQKAAQNSPQPVPQRPLAVPRASFVADPDDEEEIKKHQEELNKILAETPKNNLVNHSDPSNLVTGLISKMNLTFEVDVYKKRFIKISESRIKEIRSSIETEEVLRRAKKIGGLELTEEKAKKIVKELNIFVKDLPKKPVVNQENIKENINSAEDETMKQTILAPAPPAFVPMPKVPEKKVEETKKQKIKLFQKQTSEIKQSEAKQVQVKSDIVEEKTVPVIKKISPEEEQQKKDEVDELYKKTPSQAMAQISKARMTQSDRPQVIDIKQPSSTLGPVEEIGEIDTKQFRRMGEDPSSSAEKVLEKMYLLEEESWEERMNGLQAWQRSPIFQLYIELGRESIKKGISIAQTIDQRDSEKKLNLHLEEFLAINSLNNQLVI